MPSFIPYSAVFFLFFFCTRLVVRLLCAKNIDWYTVRGKISAGLLFCCSVNSSSFAHEQPSSAAWLRQIGAVPVGTHLIISFRVDCLWMVILYILLSSEKSRCLSWTIRPFLGHQFLFFYLFFLFKSIHAWRAVQRAMLAGAICGRQGGRKFEWGRGGGKVHPVVTGSQSSPACKTVRKNLLVVWCGFFVIFFCFWFRDVLFLRLLNSTRHAAVVSVWVEAWVFCCWFHCYWGGELRA